MRGLKRTKRFLVGFKIQFSPYDIAYISVQSHLIWKRQSHLMWKLTSDLTANQRRNFLRFLNQIQAPHLSALFGFITRLTDCVVMLKR